MTTRVRWSLINPVLSTYAWGEFTAQRTLGDTIALWRKGVRIGVFETLADAGTWLARKVDEGRFEAAE